MPYKCLAEFLEELVRAGQLVRHQQEVEPALDKVKEALEAVNTMPASLFADVKGYDYPVLCNLFSVEERILRALRVASLTEISERVAGVLDKSVSTGWLSCLRGITGSTLADTFAPRKVRSAPCQQIIRLGNDVDLGSLPLLQSGEQPPNRTVIAAIVLSADPDTHQSVCERLDLQFLDRNRLGICWADCHNLAQLMWDYRDREQKMPVAVIIGADPAFLLAASVPLASDVDRCALAAVLREKSTDIVACRTIELEVPAEAEFVLEGYIDPHEKMVMVGPRPAPLAGRLLPPTSATVLHVTAITHRANPVFVTHIYDECGGELCTMTRAMCRAFRPLIRVEVPELFDYDLPDFGAARHWAVVSIRKTYAGQARRAVQAAWSLPPLKFAKILIVVDAEIDVSDQSAVSAAVAANFRADRDVIFDRGPADPLDPAVAGQAVSEKMALDATKKLPGE